MTTSNQKDVIARQVLARAWVQVITAIAHLAFLGWVFTLDVPWWWRLTGYVLATLWGIGVVYLSKK